VETRDELERAVNDRTAMMLFYNRNEPAGQVKAAEFAELGRKHALPTFNDCAYPNVAPIFDGGAGPRARSRHPGRLQRRQDERARPAGFHGPAPSGFRRCLRHVVVSKQLQQAYPGYRARPRRLVRVRNRWPSVVVT
jgi:hypothetical protein